MKMNSFSRKLFILMACLLPLVFGPSVLSAAESHSEAETLSVGGHHSEGPAVMAFEIPVPIDANGALPPALILIVGALLLPFLPRALRSILLVGAPLLTLFYVYGSLKSGMVLHWEFVGLDLMPLRVDSLSLVFGGVFSLVGGLAGLYAFHNASRREAVAALLYNAGALGVTFAGDTLTLYAFWELMAVASTVLIWARGRADSLAAGKRYILVHLFGGALLLGGALLHFGETGSLAFNAFAPGTGGLAAWLMLLGIAVNAAVPGLGAWLPDSYPRATITGAVYCSALTTKTAVYALLRGFAGWETLIPVGCVMVIFGVIYGLLANDIRRLLAYCIVSQVGYMVAACGIGTVLALNGAATHAVSHILYKSVLFMAAGAVIHATGRETLSRLGGLVRQDRTVLGFYIVGALSISGVPFFNGFISKSMINAAAQQAHLDWVFLVLMLGSVGTALYAGLRLPFGVWGGEAPEGEKIDWRGIPWNMKAAMGLSALGCLLLGIFPDLLYGRLPFEQTWEPYTLTHLLEMGQILAFTFLGFLVVRPWLNGVPVTLIDSDFFYRSLAPLSHAIFVESVGQFFDRTQEQTLRLKDRLVAFFEDPTERLPGALARVASDEPGFDADRTRRPVGVSLAATLTILVVLAFWVLLRG